MKRGGLRREARSRKGAPAGVAGENEKQGGPSSGARKKARASAGKTGKSKLGATPGPDLERRLVELEADNRWLRSRSKELEAERDEYQELYQIGPLAAVTLDASYSIHRLNHAAALLLHDVPERIYHRNFRSFLSAESRPLFSQHLARVAGRGSIESVRLRVEPAPDESFPVEIWTRVAPFRGIFEMRIVDLTEQERLEEQALRLSESEREAREESAAKDKFIAVLSHELRTPLTPVLAATSALQRKRLAPELSDVFRMIERNVSAEARLIDDLLDVNRIV
ncbi:MAG TPA: histidine kinase dimerization/phospho-acceptor domain-containing protein, partial [Polyangiaceae bacterium]